MKFEYSCNQCDYSWEEDEVAKKCPECKSINIHLFVDKKTVIQQGNSIPCKTESEWFAENIQEIIGTRIVNAVVSNDKESWGFRVAFPNGKFKIVWVSCDPEGNGPGFLDIEKKFVK